MTCQYCDYWYRSPVIRKKNGIWRKCIARKKLRQSVDKSCKYFNMAAFFYCTSNNCQLTYYQCLARRRNEKGFLSWENCKNCRQFDQDVRPIIEKYLLDMNPTVTPRRLLKVRREQENDSGSVRKIKRRSKDQNRRQIKRRDKPKQRKIKRRK